MRFSFREPKKGLCLAATRFFVKNTTPQGVEIFYKTQRALTLWKRYKHRNTFALDNENHFRHLA